VGLGMNKRNPIAPEYQKTIRFDEVPANAPKI
jgi:hypothetical protein